MIDDFITKKHDFELASCFIGSYLASKMGLEKLGILRTQRDIQADYAEWLAAELFGLELATNTVQEGWDAKDDTYTYQIKCRKVKSLCDSTSFDFKGLKANFDFLICVFFAADLQILGVIKVPYAVVEEVSAQNKSNMRFRWNRERARDERIEKFYWSESENKEVSEIEVEGRTGEEKLDGK